MASLRAALEKLPELRETIVILTEKFGREYPELIDEVRLSRSLPLLIEIPDRHGTRREENFITSYVNEAVGLKI